MFGVQGEGRGELEYPRGIAVDNDNMVYVTDENCVSVFTSEGHFMTSFGRKGRYNRGVAVDDGVVYVCDICNNRIECFAS